MEKNNKKINKGQMTNFYLLIFCYLNFWTLFVWVNKNNKFALVISIILYLLIPTLICKKFVTFANIFWKSIFWAFGKRWVVFWIFLSLLLGFWLTLNIPLPFPPFQFNPYITKIYLKLLLYISYSCNIGFLFFIISFAFSNLQNKDKGGNWKKRSSRIFTQYFFPMIIIWFIYFLAFYPGMMSADSFNQWKQVLTGVYVNHHPVFHTLFIWLLTRIYLSPAVVAIAQILLMAIVAALFYLFYDTINIPKWAIWISLLIFSIIPVNGTMVNTIWKDIPYGISMMCLAYFIVRVLYSSGQWIKKWQNLIPFGLILVVIPLLRHDGLVISIGTFFSILILFPKMWKSWLITIMVFMFIYFGVRGPLFKYLKVQESKSLEESSLSLMNIAAYALPESEPDLLIKSMEIWPPNWNCSIWTNMSIDWKKNSLDKSQSMGDIFVNFAKRIPKILLYDYRCERALEFIIWDPYGEVRNTSHVQVLIDPNPYGIVPESKIPELREMISNFVVETSQNPNFNWFIWRPAFFLYLTLFVSTILILRNRNIKFILLFIPSLLQAITFTLIFAAPNFRYYYATYLIAIISLPLVLSPKILLTNNSSKQKELSPEKND